MKPYSVKSIWAGALAVALLVASPAKASETEGDTEYTDEACIECHRTGSEESDLHMDVDAYQASIHAQEELTCQDCHSGVVDDSHQSEEGSGAVDCSDCHEQENAHGPEDAPLQCHECHPKHNMRTKTDPASAVHPDRLPVTCGECHPAATGDEDYFSWFPSFQIASHAKGDFGTAYERDNCLGCHQGAGAHGESEPINDETCYKCHYDQDATGALWGEMHPVADRQTQPVIFAAASLYQVFIVGGLAALVVGFFRSRTRARSRQGEPDGNTGQSPQ